MSRFLVTGGCGLAGSHIVETLVHHGHEVTVLDCLTYAGPLSSLAHLTGVKVVHHDFSRPLPELGSFNYVVHNGAESHVMRSLSDPGKFVRSNVIGTLSMLEWARQAKPKKFVYVSTDEVFGPAGPNPWREGDVLRPTNPYSATKAGGEFLAHSYWRSFGVPVVTTRTINMFGERQHQEKFVPLVVKKVLRGEVVDIDVHGGVMGSRRWVYAGVQARATAYLAQHGAPGCVYHVDSGVRKTNLEMAQLIANILGVKLNYRLREVKGDLDYDIRESPQAAAWKMTESFEELLTRTVLWHRDHQ